MRGTQLVQISIILCAAVSCLVFFPVNSVCLILLVLFSYVCLTQKCCRLYVGCSCLCHSWKLLQGSNFGQSKGTSHLFSVFQGLTHKKRELFNWEYKCLDPIFLLFKIFLRVVLYYLLSESVSKNIPCLFYFLFLNLFLVFLLCSSIPF